MIRKQRGNIPSRCSFVFLAFLAFHIKPVQANIRLPSIMSSNMILQRNAEVSIWGWSDENEVTLDPSWLSDRILAKVDDHGKWLAKIQTNDSRDLMEIRISDKSSEKLLSDVLFGEVWLCSGQSNMEQPVRGNYGQPTFGSLHAIAHSRNSEIRLFKVKKSASKEPLEDLGEVGWTDVTPTSVITLSAIAYFFARDLQKILDVPVGIIQTAYGGSPIEAWLSSETLSQYQEFNLTNTDLSDKSQQNPTVLYNAMVNPLIPFTIKGALWYQGESNRGRYEEYKKLFPAMVSDWRDRWGLGDFPFYFVQIAPFPYWNQSTVFQGSGNSAFMRETQVECVELIPNSNIAITLDIGDSVSIHPPKKKEVADRLLYLALRSDYGQSNLPAFSPQYDSMIVSDNKCILTFEHAQVGLYAPDRLKNFEIAGADRVFYPAHAKIFEKSKVEVFSDKVAKPKAVRYAWSNWVEGSLFSTFLLPVSSFRTDDWESATRTE